MLIPFCWKGNRIRRRFSKCSLPLMLPREKLLNMALLSSKINKCPTELFLDAHVPICPLSKLHNPILGKGIESQTLGLTYSTDHPKDMHTHTGPSQTLFQSH